MVTSVICSFKEQIKLKVEEIKKLKADRRDSKKRSDAQYKLHYARPQIRCMHIAYSLLRGRKYEEIERPAIDNEPDWGAIEELKIIWGSDG